MGREIRKVPPNYIHLLKMNPYRGGVEAQPMFDTTFAKAAEAWKQGFAGHNPAECDGLEYWELDGGPPDRDYYRTWSDEEATWWQAWETVSEGTPVSPPFATQEELITYLAEHGDFWDQERGDAPWGREAAASFVKAGWAPSFISSPETGMVAGKLVA